MEESNHNAQHHRHVPAVTSSLASTSFDASSTSLVSTSHLVIEENQEENDETAGNIEGNIPGGHHHNQEQEDGNLSSGASYRLNLSILRDDIWSCLAGLVAFWLFASFTMILGYYGSKNVELGPNCSRLVEPSPFLIQSLKAEELGEPKPGPILYGFYKPPPLDVEIIWTQKHNAFVPMDFHKANLSLLLSFFYKTFQEWVLFLNKGSKVDISYSVKSLSASPLSLVIAQGTESLVEWIDDPSYPNTTLSWNIIYGSGNIQQEIPTSSTYYIAVGNLNSEEVEGASNEDWYVKLSYGPRWIIYIVGSGVMTVLLLLALRLCHIFRPFGRDRYQAGEIESERTPLLSQKGDDSSSWDSSHDSSSHEAEDLEKWLAVNCLEGKSLAEGEDLRRLCVICFDAPRECFFLPCGHCAACFTCGTRYIQTASLVGARNQE
ncbi:unnamed protein product [Dovyalis caffra]|uniref:RING-type domain-containing protein n=1 Tax=Dovyalis caffra TaxID=77055 RepID=A0AAV1RAS4_9ROSI|nr:unnamed protein product [Dovyalis caffra]